jgi:hypothetical protein
MTVARLAGVLRCFRVIQGWRLGARSNRSAYLKRAEVIVKIQYVMIMIMLVLAAVAFELLVFVSPLGDDTRLGNAIEGVGVFVALLAAVIALAATDPKAERVQVTIEPSVDKNHVLTYRKNELPPDLTGPYDNLPDPVESRRVLFKITNVSGFTLENPVLTFRLPLQKQHPHKQGQNYGLTFRSNLFNSQRELRLLEFADTRILSNSNLPYWNHGDDITIWIRMVLGAGGLEPFTVEVSVNSENTSGVTKRVEIDPARLLKQ